MRCLLSRCCLAAAEEERGEEEDEEEEEDFQRALTVRTKEGGGGGEGEGRSFSFLPRSLSFWALRASLSLTHSPTSRRFTTATF